MTNSVVPPISRRPPAALTWFLALVIVFFLGILVLVYVVTKRANPVMLDQGGKPIAEQSTVPETSR